MRIRSSHTFGIMVKCEICIWIFCCCCKVRNYCYQITPNTYIVVVVVKSTDPFVGAVNSIHYISTAIIPLEDFDIRNMTLR